eukprot:8257711-Lingulodinium_polyedra.AAC.1
MRARVGGQDVRMHGQSFPRVQGCKLYPARDVRHGDGFDREGMEGEAVGGPAAHRGHGGPRQLDP